MSPYIFIAIGLTFLGIGIYQVFRSRIEVSQISSPIGKGAPQEKEAKDFHQVLEEAIEVALADGTLTQREEILLREKAKLADKDPDELIVQLREDLIGLEDAETEIIDIRQRAGLEFEKYVVQKFNSKFFKINQWAGDKFVAGRYAETTLEPDIQFTLEVSEGKFPLAVECKWRNDTESDFIQFAEDHQLTRYQEFERRTGKPTFIVLGVGGKPSDPAMIYVIPVLEFQKGNQHKGNLGRFKKRSLDRDFFYDQEKRQLW